MPKAQPEPVLRSILRTPGSQSFRSFCKVRFAHLDTVQTRTEYLGPEDWYNYRLNRFTSNLQELKRKQYSKNPNELLHICKESADIIRIELPEYLNCFWTDLLDVPQKFETLKKGQHCIKQLEDEINLQIQESKKMSGSDKSHQTPPQLSQQPLQPSNVLETPKSNPSVDPELNSSTMMYGDENPNELQRIEDERKKQQEEQMLKFDADFKTELLVKEKSFERKKKELEQQLEELHKSHRHTSCLVCRCIQGITKPTIRQLARRGGVKRGSGLIFEDTRGVLTKHTIRRLMAQRGGVKRRRGLIFKDTRGVLTKHTIRQLARRGGVKRMSGLIFEDTLGVLIKPTIRTLAQRGGVKRMSGEIFEETRGALKNYLESVIRDAVTYTEHAKRKTVVAVDIVHALKRQGKTSYGFGG